MPSSSVLVRAG